jgi:hypothetical protein
MSLDLVGYNQRYVLWGKELPIINIYDSDWVTLNDNIRMGFRNLEVIDSKNEMENGLIRKRVRGYRFYVDFSIQNLENRALLMFLRKMWMADHVVITPHDGTMMNPRTHNYDFEMLINSDFNPEYLENRWIGHIISFTLESVYLLDSIPEDTMMIHIIEATTMRVAGVTSADPQTSLTFPNEKMLYGGWELTAEDLAVVAFVETAPEEEQDPYGTGF